MSHTVVAADATLIRRIRTQMMIIGLLTIIILGLLFYFFYNRSRTIPRPHTKKVSFVQSVSDGMAENGIENYKEVAKFTSISASKGVLYDAAEIRNYLDNIYPQIIGRHDTHRGGAIPAGYQWKIAFYWMVGNKGTDVDKLSLYVVPVLFNPTTNDVKDYFKVSQNAYYNHPANDLSPKNVYNEGHLWP